MEKPLTHTMIECLQALGTAGEFVRYQSGYWAPRSVARHRHNGLPQWSFGSSTIYAVEARGYAAFTEWQDGRNGRFPIAVRPCPSAQKA